MKRFLIKLGAFVAVAFVTGVFCKLTDITPELMIVTILLIDMLDRKIDEILNDKK